MLELKAQPREILGKKVKKLRKTGYIPAILYGHRIKSVPLEVRAREFQKALNQAGETSILYLLVGGKKHNVLIHDLAKDPLTDEILHVDFYEVRMDEKLKAKIPLVFIGESPAIKAEGGVLVRAIQEIEVEALPQDLPKEIAVEISFLNTFEDKIFIKGLSAGEKVKILAEPEATVAFVAPPRSEEELKEIEAKPVEEVGEIKVVGEEEKAAKEAAQGTEAQAEAKEEKNAQ
ncbi:50S ribosomal protein L25 [Patescibacteria group bacterium]|nr:50S ribosomal protein L25 [Patescibacteria group bacterium]